MSGTSPTGTSTTQKGGRLGPALIAFIVFDVLLVGWAVWLAVSMSSDDSTGDAAPEPTASASAPATPQPTSDAGDEPEPGTETVASPTGNITCAVAPSGVECGIASLGAEPAPVEGCDGSTGYVVSLTSEGVSVPCVGADDLPAKADATIDILDYGQTVTVNNFPSDSTEAGMKCTDTSTGKGFTLARAGIKEF